MRNRLALFLPLAAGCAIAFVLLAHAGVPAVASLGAQSPTPPVLKVPAIQDFAVNGLGDNAAWNAAPWTTLNARAGVTAPLTRMKVAWSPAGLTGASATTGASPASASGEGGRTTSRRVSGAAWGLAGGAAD